MKTLFKSQELWDLVESGYEDSDPGHAQRLRENRKKDAKALFLIQHALDDDIFPSISAAETSNEAWEILQQEFLGDKKVKAGEEVDFEVETTLAVEEEVNLAIFVPPRVISNADIARSMVTLKQIPGISKRMNRRHNSLKRWKRRALHLWLILPLLMCRMVFGLSIADAPITCLVRSHYFKILMRRRKVKFGLEITSKLAWKEMAQLPSKLSRVM